ncbi:MAG: hypothetical protein ACLFUS_10035, partial [Candidatus Sumerlaeia bacterium]
GMSRTFGAKNRHTFAAPILDFHTIGANRGSKRFSERFRIPAPSARKRGIRLQHKFRIRSFGANRRIEAFSEDFRIFGKSSDKMPAPHLCRTSSLVVLASFA